MDEVLLLLPVKFSLHEGSLYSLVYSSNDNLMISCHGNKISFLCLSLILEPFYSPNFFETLNVRYFGKDFQTKSRNKRAQNQRIWTSTKNISSSVRFEWRQSKTGLLEKSKKKKKNIGIEEFCLPSKHILLLKFSIKYISFISVHFII